MGKAQLACVLATASWIAGAAPLAADVVRTGPYDAFAVGAVRRWFDEHPAEQRARASHCMPMLELAQARQDNAMRLMEEASRPGDSQRQSALVRQANEQFAARGRSLRAFQDCVNTAIRMRPPPSGPRLDRAIDECLRPHGSWRIDWSGYAAADLERSPTRGFDQTFAVARHAARAMLGDDRRRNDYGQDDELMEDHLVGWLTHCLDNKGAAPPQDPRAPYRRFIASGAGGAGRLGEREEAFFTGYGMYPLPPMWDEREPSRP
jgi:hypothetical protein